MITISQQWKVERAHYWWLSFSALLFSLIRSTWLPNCGVTDFVFSFSHSLRILTKKTERIEENDFCTYAISGWKLGEFYLARRGQSLSRKHYWLLFLEGKSVGWMHLLPCNWLNLFCRSTLKRRKVLVCYTTATFTRLLYANHDS